jgi:aryl-alcohol dehydrogenase-like predicted oxidoreductase
MLVRYWLRLVAHRVGFTAENMQANQVVLDLIRTLAEEKHAIPAQIALAWVLKRNPRVVPIPGTRKIHRLQENVQAADIILTDDEYLMLNKALDTMTIAGSRIERVSKEY